MSILVDSLTKIYGSQKAVDSASFAIAAGEIVGFLGPNGAGKSTTMKIITGFLKSNEGKALVNDKDAANDKSTRLNIGYLPELNPLYYDMYVVEYLDFVARLNKIKDRKAAIEKVIDQTGLHLERKKKIIQLSKGYKQRVGLAQALINDPAVLILDEPTSGLDPNQMADIRQLIIDLGKDKTILLSSHIMQEIEAICDRVIIINKGEIVADGKVSEIKQQMESGSNRTIEVRYRDSVSTELLRVKGVKEVIETAKNSYNLTYDVDLDIYKLLLDVAVVSNTVILEQKEQEQTLESIFQRLTKNV